MNNISCDVVILPERNLAAKAICASQSLREFDAYYTLEQDTYFPHVSLYMLELNTRDISKAEELLTGIATEFSSFQLEAYRYDHTLGYIDAEYRKFIELDDLQVRVIKALSPIRDGMREKDKVRMLNAEGQALKNFQDYGYQNVGELFRPHISFTRLRETNDSAIHELGNVTSFSGTFLRLGLFEMGENGTCVRNIKTFNFLG